MNTFKNLINRLRPANRHWDFMEVKELSERMEMAEIQAREAIMVLRACKKQYANACEAYMKQCQVRHGSV